MQIRISRTLNLLDNHGYLTQSGYATQPYWIYNKKAIKAPWWRIKEWDYYAIIDQDSGFALCLTASDLGYAGLQALCLVDIPKGTYEQVDALTAFPMGRMGFASTADEDHRVESKAGNLQLSFVRHGASRTLRIDARGFSRLAADRVVGELTLLQPAETERMVIASSWAGLPRAFYYNQKINCMPVSGSLNLGNRTIEFKPESTLAVLDWGRGRWPYTSHWYWASCSAYLEGEPFGFNLGYGFSDRSAASENMVFYRGVAHKLSQVDFQPQPGDYLAPWNFSSDDGRFEAVFTPTVDRQSHTNLVLIRSKQHQCFGYFSGKAVLDDRRVIHFDGLPGFTEDIYNRW
jgi:hypothetical protein